MKTATAIIWNILRHRRRAWLAFICGLMPLLLSAQIITDGTVGAVRTLTGPAFQIPETLGAIRGQNLFQSFQTFNLHAGESATFSGPNSIANVFSRVTGGNLSTLDGALKCTIPRANFFFLNPAGVVFGPNASIDVGGSFAVTTADYLTFAGEGRFDARTPANDVLTVANPVAFGFLAPEQGSALGSVVFQGARLDFKEGQNVTVAAGDIAARKADPADSTGPSAKLTVPGKLGILSVASAGEARVDTLAVQGFSQMGDVALSDGAEFSTMGHGQNGGFLIRAGNLRLDGGSKIEQSQSNPGGGENRIELQGNLQLANASKIESQTSGKVDGMDLKISAREVEASQASGLACGTTGPGKGGRLSVYATDITLADGGFISSRTEGLGDAGSVFMDLAGELIIGDNSASATFTGVDASSLNNGLGGAAGNIDIKAKGIRILNGGEIISSTFGQGKGGSVSLAVEGDLEIDGKGFADFVTGVAAGSYNEKLGGAAGDIDIKAKGIRIFNGGEIMSSTFGQGKGGSVSLAVEGDLEIDGKGFAGILTGVDASSENEGLGGAAGNVVIKAKGIRIFNGGEIMSSTFGQGKGGSVSLAVEGDLEIDGKGFADFVTGVDASSLNNGLGGAAGNIDIKAKGISISNGGQIMSSTFGQGKGGSVSLAVEGDLEIDGKGLARGLTGVTASSRNTDLGGAAGNIDIKAKGIRILNGGEIISSTFGQGQGGSVSLAVEGDLEIDGQDNTLFTGVAASSENKGLGGAAGNIDIQAKGIRILNGGQISSSTSGQGQGGSVSLDVEEDLEIDGKGFAGGLTGVAASSENGGLGGAAGNIDIKAKGISISNGGQIISSTFGLGQGGSVNLAVDGDLLIDGEDLTGHPSCVAASSENKNQVGAAGNIGIKAKGIRLFNGGQIISSTFGQGQGGSVSLAVEGDLEIDGHGNNTRFTGVAASSENKGLGGAAGNIDIKAKGIRVLNGGQISSNTYGQGKGGSVSLDVEEDLEIDGKGFAGDLTGVAASSENDNLGGAAGNIDIQAKGIQLFNGGQIISSTFGQGQGGSVSLTVEGDLEIDGHGNNTRFTGVAASSENEGLGGAAGNIDIKAKGIRVLNGGQISSSTYGQGKGGSVSLDVEEDLEIDGKGFAGGLTGVAASSANENLGGAAGDIDIKAKGLRIFNGGQIISSTFGQGQGGSVSLAVDGDLEIDGKSFVGGLTGVTASSENENLGGVAGNIDIKAKGIRIFNGGQISSSTFGQGQGGSVSLDVEENLEIDGKGLAGGLTGVVASSENENLGGVAGNIDIKASKTLFLNGGAISTATRGQGHAGAISLKISEQIAIDGGGEGAETGIYSDSINTGNGGQAGGIMLATPDLRLWNKGLVGSGSAGSGNAGSVIIDCQKISLNDSQIATAAKRGGDAGRIVIGALEKPRSITLEKGASITSSAGTGRAGDIEINSSGAIRVEEGVVSVQSAGGDAGTVYLLAPEVIVLWDSLVSAKAGRNGGNITIDPHILGLEDSSLIADAKSGNGGRISLSADFVYLLGSSRISAISENQSAQQGTVSIRSGVDFANSLDVLNGGGLLAESAQLRLGCARKNPRANSLIIRGKGGIARRPDAFLSVFDFGSGTPDTITREIK